MKTAEELVLDGSFCNWVNKTDPEDQEFWERWVHEHPEQKDQIELAIAMINGIGFESSPGLSQQEISERFMQLNKQLEEKRTTHIRFSSWKVVYKAAAFFTIVALTGLALWNNGLFGSQQTHRTGFGETAVVALPDGSEVILNGNSTLTYNGSWEKDELREVWLTGEAFFSVDKLPNGKDNTDFVKFIVHASDVDIQVIGTEFNVKDRRDETQVVLNSGKVELVKNSVTDAPVTSMIPGELVKTVKGSPSFQKKKVDPNSYSSWTKNQLLFDETPLQEIIHILEDTYGLTTRIRDPSINELKLTGELNVNSADDIISTLSLALNIKIERKDNVLMLDHH